MATAEAEERLAQREQNARARVEARARAEAVRQRRRQRLLFHIRQTVILVLCTTASAGVILIMTLLINGVSHLRNSLAG